MCLKISIYFISQCISRRHFHPLYISLHNWDLHECMEYLHVDYISISGSEKTIQISSNVKIK